MLITRKITKDKRPVVDFRLLNTRIKRHNTATPLLRDIYQMLGKAQSTVLSCVDLKDAFHSLKLTEKAKDYCGILPYFGTPHYRYEVMPMGLSISPCKWIQYIGYVMEKMPHPENYIAIMDDLLVHSRESEHMNRILDMLKALVEHGLKLSPKKCQFFRNELVYMGNTFRTGQKGITITPIKTRTEAILNTPAPTTAKDCKSFYGVVNYVSLFCPHLQKLLAPIYDLTRKGRPFVWTQLHQENFDKIKKQMASPPVLTLPTSTGRYILYSDTSKLHAGSALWQIQNGKPRLVRNEEMEENALRRGVLPRSFCKERIELEKLIEEADKKNEELDKELQELDEKDKDKQVLCDEQLRTKQWIEDVRKAMSKGAPIPDKPEEIDIAYPSLEIRKKTPEEAPNEEDSIKQPPTPGTCGLDPLEEEVPAYKMPPENKDPDSVPLEEAVAQLCGPKEDEGPPVPLEPEVVINNMPAPAATLSKDRDIEANRAGRDVDQGDGGDSDCQIVDENPPETPRPKTSRPTPQGLWKLKKAKDTSVTLQLVPHKEGENSDVPPTPGPSPPGTMKKWPTQDLSKIVVEKEKPTSSEENVHVPTSSQEEKQEKQD